MRLECTCTLDLIAFVLEDALSISDSLVGLNHVYY